MSNTDVASLMKQFWHDICAEIQSRGSQDAPINADLRLSFERLQHCIGLLSRDVDTRVELLTMEHQDLDAATTTNARAQLHESTPESVAFKGSTALCAALEYLESMQGLQRSLQLQQCVAAQLQRTVWQLRTENAVLREALSQATKESQVLPPLKRNRSE